MRNIVGDGDLDAPFVQKIRGEQEVYGMKKKYLRIFIIVVAAVIVCTAVSLPIAVPLVNDRMAGNIMNEVQSVPVPEKTTVVKSVSEAGKLVGNGNGMQYFGAVLIETELTADEVETHYSKYRKGKWDLLIDTPESHSITEIRSDKLTVEDRSAEKSYYWVYTWGAGDFPLSWLDIRAH